MEKAFKTARVLLASLTLAAAACGDSTPPTAPTNPSPEAALTPGSALKVTAPAPVSPAHNVTLDTRQPTLVVSNPVSPNAPTATLRVRFVVLDQAGNRLHQSALQTLGQGQTSYLLPNELDAGRTYQWLAEAVWNDTTGPASAPRLFTTQSAVAPPPTTAPQGDLCAGNGLSVVACQRDRFPGHMNSQQFVQFLRAVVHNLNANGEGGGPFGLLRKAVGHNCEGYSCDIICSGQGGGQRQWDVISDIDGAQSPVWNGPIGTIRADVCEM